MAKTAAATPQDCIFCQIVAGQIPCHKIWEDAEHLAFLSIFPNTEGFSVVIPKTHYPSYAFATSDEVLTKLVMATKKVARLLDASFPDVARCGMFFEGYGVDHLHSKLYPMHGTAKNTAENSSENLKVLESETFKAYFEIYPGYLCSNDAARADDQKLAELAEKIRRHGVGV